METTPRIAAMINHVNGPDVLSLGCAGTIRPEAPDWLHGALLRAHPSTVGLDCDAEAVSNMRRLGHDAVVGDAQAFDLGRKFDTIVAGEVIEHLENPGQFLRRCAAHLKPHGQVVLSTCYAFSLPNLVRAFARYPHTCSNGEHVAWYCPSTLIELCQRSGFDVSHWELTSSYVICDTPWTYNTLVRTLRGLGPLIPGRLRHNTLVAVLRARAEQAPVPVPSRSSHSCH
jgi:2-polyprenyl-3-methyl-5-hydroxy-6-metoxy-1,4-benzoquinol methylase